MANNPWFRVWSDMINDPKWRTIARVSKQRIGDVVAVYLHMLTYASNATERGRTQGLCDEDVATALDIETAQVIEIREAMQGRVLDGDYLCGWEKRQPIREDSSADRSRAWREEKKLEKEKIEKIEKKLENATERKRTQCDSREEKIREDIKEKDTPNGVSKKKRVSPKTSLPENFGISDRVREWAATKGHVNLDAHLENFLSACRKSGYEYVDWDEALMDAIRKDWANLRQPARASPNGYESPIDKQKKFFDSLTAKNRNEFTNQSIIDIN